MDDLHELRTTNLPRHHRDAQDEMRWAADEIERLRATKAELTEVLNGFVLNWRHLNDDHFTGPRDKLLALAEAAIAKATGGQP